MPSGPVGAEEQGEALRTFQDIQNENARIAQTVSKSGNQEINKFLMASGVSATTVEIQEIK
jgi:hypothetical protein